MYFYNYVVLVGFFLLCFNKRSRFAALVFLSGWALYLVFVIGASEVSYYAKSATVELIVGFVLNKRYRAISYISYILVVVNFAGFTAHSVQTAFPYFDFVYACLSVIQFLLLLLRVMPDGINRLHSKHFMVRLLNFDSRGAYDRMHKNKQAKGSNQ